MGEVENSSNPTKVEWSYSETHSQRLNNLLVTGYNSDLKLILGKEKAEVNVHKIFLESGSRVLDSLISKCESNTLIIEDVDLYAFKMMLKYFYTGSSGATMTDALQLLGIATEFEVAELRDQCAEILKGDLTLENVLPLFQQAMLFAQKELINATLNYICKRGIKVLKRKEFLDLPLDCLIEIIQQDNLRICDEIDVFNAVFSWGKAECKRQNLDENDNAEMRKVLNKALMHVRFPVMDSKKFALHVATKNLLGMEESMALLTCFLVPPEERSVLPPGRFISTPRTFSPLEVEYSKECTCTRLHSYSQYSFSVINSAYPCGENLMVMSEKPIFLKGFNLVKLIFDVFNNNSNLQTSIGSSNITVNVQVFSTDDNKLLTEKNLKNLGHTVETIKLENPIILLPQRWVTIKMEFSGTIKDTYGRVIWTTSSGSGSRDNGGHVRHLKIGNGFSDNCLIEGGNRLQFKREEGDRMSITLSYIQELLIAYDPDE